MNKPFSPACKRNSEPILSILKQYIDKGQLLEIGSGTGQHAVYFAKHFPELNWICSDIEGNHPGIKAWLEEAQLSNLYGPETFMAGRDELPGDKPFEYAFTANSLHIMPWKDAKVLFDLLGKNLIEKGRVFFYGPFNYNGEYTSESNRKFDVWLSEMYSETSAIRNFEDVLQQMQKNNFKLLCDHEMPANNRLLVFERT